MDNFSIKSNRGNSGVCLFVYLLVIVKRVLWLCREGDIEEEICNFN